MDQCKVPKHILIVGSGAFGLSTAYALTKRPAYAASRITLVSYEFNTRPSDSNSHNTNNRAIPASIDTTRIIRADYADPLYAELASEAQKLWRSPQWGCDGKYNEPGLVLTAGGGSAGEAYVRKSLANVKAQRGTQGPRILSSKEDIAVAMRADPTVARGTGNVGYFNPQSGWADAGRCMRDLESRVRATRKVDFVQGKVKRIVQDPGSSSVAGVELDDGSFIEADFTVLATGAWTPTLVDLNGRASATAHVMAYFDISEEAARKLTQIPVHFNLQTGCFLFPPNKKSDGGFEIKAARHAFGYANPQLISAPLGCAGNVRTSIPVSSCVPIPEADQMMLSEFLSNALPGLGNVGKPSRTRLCHYLDTVYGDFIVGNHPDFSGLFLTTAGSGHAFKFLPVLGETVVDVLSGTDANKRWTRKWQVPQRASEDQVWCGDGSRSGKKGLTLADVLDGNLTARL